MSFCRHARSRIRAIDNGRLIHLSVSVPRAQHLCAPLQGFIEGKYVPVSSDYQVCVWLHIWWTFSRWYAGYVRWIMLTDCAPHAQAKEGENVLDSVDVPAEAKN